MFKSLKWCHISSKLITQINSPSMRCGITPITIQSRGMRRYYREPVKVLTDSGEDYETHWSTKQRVSTAKQELSRDVMKKINKYSDQYYDEAIFDDNNELSYSRKKGRKAKQNDDDFDDFDPYYEEKATESFQTKRKQFDKQKTKQKQFNKPKTYENPKTYEIPKSEKELRPKIPGIPVYEKLGENNREFFTVMNSIKSRNYREKKNLMILEGTRIINDAIDANVFIKTIYFSLEANLVGIKRLTDLVKSGVELKKVFYKDMKLFSDTVTCPGVMVVCNKPENQQIMETHNYIEELKLPLIVVCDNIRDPGNMGTLIRSCAAFGVEKIVLTKGCVDAWEPKVIRSGSGAHFRIPIVNNVEWLQINEELFNENIYQVFIAESNPTQSILNTKNARNEFNSYDNQSLTNEDDGELKRYITQTPLVSLMYNEANFFRETSSKKCVLVIGGETQGLSVESYKFAHQYNGRRVKIPLSYGVDSLNSATAATIILYEIKRQYLIRSNEQTNQHVLSVI